MANENVIGKCPICGGDIIESPKAYGCSHWKEEDGGCRFAIWKTIAQRPISVEEAQMLLEKGCTPTLDGFTSKAGKSFSTALVVGDDGKIEFKFEDKKGS